MQLLVGFQDLALGVLFQDHFGTGNLKLIALAAHGLDQNGQVQLTAAGNNKRISLIRLFHAQGDIVPDLVEKALAELARGAPAAFPPGQGRRIHPKAHPHRRLVHLMTGKATGCSGSASVSPMAT